MKILITGICGTWGKEFTRLLLSKGHKITGVDNTEQAIVSFRHDFPQVEAKLMNFHEIDFGLEKIDVLIHLAAHKHIDICEENVFEAVQNNVIATAKLFQNAQKNNVKILFISTDKAVEPVSVYGFTKALGEHLAWEAGGQVARSGNIIGSNGSVFQIWEKAIKNQEKIRLTDPNMRRFFIKVGYAVKTAWEGFKKGEKLVLINSGELNSMGDILETLLNTRGYTKENYPGGIEITGRRPGEKVVEKLEWDWEK